MKPVNGFFSPNFKVRNEPRYLGNPIRTTTRYWVPRLSTARTFAPMAVISLTSTPWPQSNEEYGIVGNHESHPVQLLSRILFLMRYRCLCVCRESPGTKN